MEIVDLLEEKLLLTHMEVQHHMEEVLFPEKIQLRLTDPQPMPQDIWQKILLPLKLQTNV